MESLSIELQKLIEKEELIKDAMKLQKYRSSSKFENLIDKVRDELADETDDMGKLSIIYKFAERLKEELD